LQNATIFHGFPRRQSKRSPERPVSNRCKTFSSKEGCIDEGLFHRKWVKGDARAGFACMLAGVFLMFFVLCMFLGFDVVCVGASGHFWTNFEATYTLDAGLG